MNSQITLTGNERKVLLLHCQNYRSKQIAATLQLNFEEVQTINKWLRKTFGANQMTTVVFRAMALKLLSDTEIKMMLQTWNPD